MADEVLQKKPENPLSNDDLEFRRYEARLGVWKVVLGTMIVGLAAVLIPGAVSFYTSYFETQRKDAEFRQAQQAAHQQYIKDFFETAVNQDIELRIRFADYFANVSGPDQKELWTLYLNSQEMKREKLRKAINSLELKITLKDPGKERAFARPEDAAAFNELERELAWAYREIGYVPVENTATANDSDIKRTLYLETLDVVMRLVQRTDPFDPAEKDWVRFWTLYSKDLIGIETPEFARAMVAFGNALKKSNAEKLPPDEELKALAEKIRTTAASEFTYFGVNGLK